VLRALVARKLIPSLGPPPFPHRLRSSNEWENPFYDLIYDAKLLERSLRLAARPTARRSSMTKAFLIILGALTATKAVADEIAGAGNSLVVVVYALFGVLTATLAGFLAAFKWEERSAELNVLVSDVKAWVRDFEIEWRREVRLFSPSATGPPKDKVDKVLELAEKRLQVLERRAAELGVLVEEAPEIRFQSSADTPERP
jgi:hypothetical protein